MCCFAVEDQVNYFDTCHSKSSPIMHLGALNLPRVLVLQADKLALSS